MQRKNQVYGQKGYSDLTDENGKGNEADMTGGRSDPAGSIGTFGNKILVGAYTDATHGMTLFAVSLPYYRYIMPYGLEKFRRFAVNVQGVDTAGKSDEQWREIILHPGRRTISG